jgi:hypothetical protein
MTGFTTKGRQYLDDGVPVPSVTTILDSWPKQLTKWAADTVAGYAVDNWDELSDLPVSARIRKLEQSVWAKRDEASMRGTEIHTHGEALVAGVAPAVPDELVGPIEAYARFLDKWRVEPIIVERPVLNRTHGYAGRPDLQAAIGAYDGETWLLDIKSGKHLYESQVLQLVAYARAEIYLDESKTEREWPVPARCGIVHVLPDVAQLHPVAADARAFRTFLYTAENAKYARDCRAAFTERRPWPVGPALNEPKALEEAAT